MNRLMKVQLLDKRYVVVSDFYSADGNNFDAIAQTIHSLDIPVAVYLPKTGLYWRPLGKSNEPYFYNDVLEGFR
ncbi:hypothetical protein [Motilimonas pumila]|uniref:Uncharacterized protein n=1 Tax=Motilimonas pumila TaxID=2303987 RepID=A0A418Y9Z9_9GAMM|nr:hypothetical protein [Motilimonas pumila]RJG38772.1 hypothetical protein D1Z90_18685 [Motilimonas pumila]